MADPYDKLGGDALADQLVHLGRGPDAPGRPVNLPIDQGSTFLFDRLEDFQAARAARYDQGVLYYGRYGNPSAFALERMMATLEGGYGCVSVAAGLTAVTMALTAATRAGAHILVADNVYEPTRMFCDGVLARYGVETSYFDPMIGAGIATLFKPNTSAVMFEAPGSGTFEVPDIPAIAVAARAAGAWSIIDGTWATPAFCKPLALGVDVVAHSGSKYICGHADAMIGLIVCNEATYDAVRRTTLAFGDKAGSQDVFLALRGLRTLELRMAHADAAGRTIAGWLDARPEVARVLHPALPGCPGHAHWARDFTGAAGLFSVELRPCGPEAVRAFVDALTLFGVGVSWGGYESLVLPVSPKRTATVWDAAGPLVRFSIGQERVDSLIADIENAFTQLN